MATQSTNEPTMRHVVTLSNLDPILHRWLIDKAQERSRASGTKVALWELVEEACRDYRRKTEEAEATAR